MTSSIRRRVLGLTGAIVLAAAVVACGGDDGGSKDSKPAANAGPALTEVTVTMTDNVFTPKAITVPAGKEVTFTAKNGGQAIHNMHILSKGGEGKDFSSDATVTPGQASVFKATFSKKGTYKFQCDLHLPDMSGTVTVVD